MSEFGSDKIVSILTIFPEISADWLLLGKGEMLRQKEVGNSPEQQEEIKMLKKNINNLNQLIDTLNDKIHSLQDELNHEKEKALSLSGKTSMELISQ
ncbi:MAG: hypothetical protein IJ764_02145 [Bacteroidales bacterium]|nr:hypothetical protein [Bacteroidales bacterium]